MRQYEFIATNSYGDLTKAGHMIETEMRIRQAALVMFRKFFGGRKPARYWHKDGFMAEAWDRRGQRVQLYQINTQ